MNNYQSDEWFMEQALAQAQAAAEQGEVPVGAIVVKDGEIISRSHNLVIHHHDPSAHAEISALRIAGQSISNYRLINTEIFVTLEPCVMCLGAILHARCRRLIFGAPDFKTGACGSFFNLLSLNHNHKISVTGGILCDESSRMLSCFFQNRRRKKLYE